MKNHFEVAKSHFPLQVSPEFVREHNPPLQLSKAILQLLLGNERKSVKVPSNGDLSLLLTYKKYEVRIASFAHDPTNEVLEISQFQGARSKKSYRGNRDIDTPLFFAHAIRTLLEHTPSIQHLIISELTKVDGILEVESKSWSHVEQTYGHLIMHLQMKWSETERKFILDNKG